MKKIIIALVLIIVAGLAAAPFFIGSKIESTTQQQAQITEQRLQEAVKTNPYLTAASFKLENYEKNYLNSTAQSRLRIETLLPVKEGEPLTLDIPIISEITHGPYLGDSGFGLTKVISHFDVSQMGLPESITSKTVTIEDIIDFTGNIDETVTVLPIKHSDEKGGSIEFGGAQAKIATSLSSRLTFDGDIVIENVKISSPENAESFELQPFTMALQGKGDDQSKTGEYQLSTSEIKGAAESGLSLSLAAIKANGAYQPAKNAELVLSQQKMTLTDLQINDPANLPEAIKLPELTLKTDMSQDDAEKINISANYSAVLDPSSLAALQLPVEVKTAALDMEMKAIPPSVLEAYTELVTNMPSEASTDADMAAMQEKLMALAQQLINNSVSTVLGVKLNNDEGALETKVDLTFTPDNELSTDDVMMLMMQASANPAALLQVVSGKGHLHLDKSITDKAQLTPMIQMMGAGFVKLEGDAFKSDLLIKDGQILVNGQPLPMLGDM